jgi:hypothetical protein
MFEKFHFQIILIIETTVSDGSVFQETKKPLSKFLGDSDNIVRESDSFRLEAINIIEPGGVTGLRV